MKYLLLLIVIAIGLWMVNKRLRGPVSKGSVPPRPSTPQVPASMVECAHCGLHLPVADAVLEGTRVYCSDAHRLLGPRAAQP